MKLIKWIQDPIKNRLYNKVSSVLNEGAKTPLYRYVEFLGEKYTQFPDVFPIDKFSDAIFFTNAIKFYKGERFLEIGVGVGVTSIIAAKKGAIVTGVDINHKAVENSILNAEKHGIKEKTKFLVSDIFDEVPEREYDTIYWNVPFCYSEIAQLSNLENSVFDFKYHSLERFIYESSKYLKSNGRLLIGFSNVCGMPDLLIRYCYEAGYKKINIIKQKYISWEKLEFDLTLYEPKKVN